jgi:SAM-dependent methyltransferase
VFEPKLCTPAVPPNGWAEPIEIPSKRSAWRGTIRRWGTNTPGEAPTKNASGSQAKVTCCVRRRERLFRAAGIGPGARVLDCGSGGGDVSDILAELVTPSGQVLGIYRDLAQVEVATRPPLYRRPRRPWCPRKPFTTTDAPRFARSSADSRPKPRPAPVTAIAWSVKSIINISPLEWLFRRAIRTLRHRNRYLVTLVQIRAAAARTQ